MAGRTLTPSASRAGGARPHAGGEPARGWGPVRAPPGAPATGGRPGPGASRRHPGLPQPCIEQLPTPGLPAQAQPGTEQQQVPFSAGASVAVARPSLCTVTWSTATPQVRPPPQNRRERPLNPALYGIQACSRLPLLACARLIWHSGAGWQQGHAPLSMPSSSQAPPGHVPDGPHGGWQADGPAGPAGAGSAPSAGQHAPSAEAGPAQQPSAPAAWLSQLPLPEAPASMARQAQRVALSMPSEAGQAEQKAMPGLQHRQDAAGSSPSRPPSAAPGLQFPIFPRTPVQTQARSCSAPSLHARAKGSGARQLSCRCLQRAAEACAVCCTHCGCAPCTQVPGPGSCGCRLCMPSAHPQSVPAERLFRSAKTWPHLSPLCSDW